MSNIPCTTGALALYRRKPAKVANFSADGKIELVLPDGEHQNVRAKDIAILHRGPVNTLPAAPLPSPDLREIAALMEDGTMPFGEFAELVYGKFTPDSAWSAWQLLEQKIYFTGDLENGVAARSVADIDAALSAVAAKANSKQQREELLERIKTGHLLPDDRSHLRDVENLALGKTETSGILRELGMEQDPVKAHRLLLKLGLWDHWVDPYPSRTGIELKNPELPVPDLPTEARLDLTALPAFAIDDEGNQDPDDAIGYHDGLLWVHVADVAALVAPDSELDREAEARGANLYLPDTIVSMLPPDITRQLGLGLQETSPALSFGLAIAEDGEVKLEKLALSTVKVTRLTYDEAEKQLDVEPLKTLSALLLGRFRDYRERHGALQIDLPEVKIKADGQQVTITPLPLLRSREIVAEAMMAAGHALAAYAVEHEIPLPFVCQPPPELTGKPETLAGMFAARRGCTVSSVQTSPGLHAGLGLEPYVRITSPLRRYSDLLAHQQIRRHLAGSPLLPSDQMDGQIAKAETAGVERRKLERIANEFWKLVYLEMHPDWEGEAVAVDRIDERLTLLLPALAYEYKLRMGGKIELNSRWSARLNTVDLAALTARFILTRVTE